MTVVGIMQWQKWEREDWWLSCFCCRVWGRERHERRGERLLPWRPLGRRLPHLQVTHSLPHNSFPILPPSRPTSLPPPPRFFSTSPSLLLFTSVAAQPSWTEGALSWPPHRRHSIIQPELIVECNVHIYLFSMLSLWNESVIRTF